jgi:hypothetical protein
MAVDYSLVRGATNRLAQRLQLPDGTTDVQIRLHPERLPEITITRLLTPAEIEEIGIWYVVEGLDRHPAGRTAYNLEPRPVAAAAEKPLDCNPVEQQARQDHIDVMYAADGRHAADHPRHATYTGLVAPAGGDG